MTQIIPMTSDGSRRATVNMGSVGVFVFRTYWNYTSSTWSMDILDANDNPLALGLTLVADINIIRAHPQLVDIFHDIRVANLDGNANRKLDSLGSGAQVAQFDNGDLNIPPTDLPPLIVSIGDVTQ